MINIIMAVSSLAAAYTIFVASVIIINHLYTK